MAKQPDQAIIKKSVLNKIIPKYVEFQTDFGFKHILGKETHLDLLRDLLNSIFEGRRVIDKITLGKNDHKGILREDRKTVFDVYCTDDQGAKFVVEMQQANHSFFKDRILYYTANLVQEQGQSVVADWDYQLPEIYLVAIMNFNFKDAVEGQYIHDVRLVDINSNKQFYDKLGHIFISLSGFNKTIDQLETNKDKWLFCLKNLGKLKEIPLPLRESDIFFFFFKIAEVSNLNHDEMNAYQQELKRKRDNYCYDMAIRENAIEQGIEQGEIKKSFSIVENMIKKLGLSNQQIADIADVSIEFVLKVRDKLK